MCDARVVVDPDIAAHYALGFESERLFIDGGPRLEYVRTLELLDRHLPPPPGRIVDVGGGTGVYAVPLVERGFEVHVVEPIEWHVEHVAETARRRELPGLTSGRRHRRRRDLALRVADRRAQAADPGRRALPADRATGSRVGPAPQP